MGDEQERARQEKERARQEQEERVRQEKIQSARTRAKAGDWTFCCKCGHKICDKQFAYNRCACGQRVYGGFYRGCCKCGLIDKDGKEF